MADKTEATKRLYDQRYASADYYWGTLPSAMCFEVLRRLPPDQPRRLLDVGCGEGRNAVFFARNGYRVSAFDISEGGVRKTRDLAAKAGVSLDVLQGEINTFRLSEHLDIIFSTAALHCSTPEQRRDIFENYKIHTRDKGLHAISVFVEKPFIAPSPDRDPNGVLWKSGELLTHYADWQIEWCAEEIFDCMSGGVPHRHAVNRIIARRP
jgi:tellurite methyltransferase